MGLNYLLKKFAIATLTLIRKVFIIYVAYFYENISIYLICEAWIALIIAKKSYYSSQILEFYRFFSKKINYKVW